MTRWHVDDLLGRLVERHKGIKVLSYPAIAMMGGSGRTPSVEPTATCFR
jgi:hypothetical protein